MAAGGASAPRCPRRGCSRRRGCRRCRSRAGSSGRGGPSPRRARSRGRRRARRRRTRAARSGAASLARRGRVRAGGTSRSSRPSPGRPRPSGRAHRATRAPRCGRRAAPACRQVRSPRVASSLRRERRHGRGDGQREVRVSRQPPRRRPPRQRWRSGPRRSPFPKSRAPDASPTEAPETSGGSCHALRAGWWTRYLPVSSSSDEGRNGHRGSGEAAHRSNDAHPQNPERPIYL